MRVRFGRVSTVLLVFVNHLHVDRFGEDSMDKMVIYHAHSN
jgi:hypothetical protein